MKRRPHRIKAVEEYWWHTEVLPPEGHSCAHTRAFADAAITALEQAVYQMQAIVQEKSAVEEGLSLDEFEAFIYKKQKRITDLENLLAAAYEAYADDGFLVTKDEWLEALLLHVKEQENS